MAAKEWLAFSLLFRGWAVRLADIPQKTSCANCTHHIF
jgi:hypothetical protein